MPKIELVHLLLEIVVCMLFLLKLGAEAIYIPKNKETPKDFEVLNNHLPDYGMRKLLLSSDKATSNKITTTLSHFGCIRQNEYEGLNPPLKYSLCTLEYPSIISSLVYYESEERGDYECDNLAPIVTLQSGLFANIQLFGSMFFKDAFWCLPLEIDFDSIQWQTLLQHVQWMMGGKIAIFHGKNSLRSSITNTSIVNEKFIEQLTTIKCSRIEDIYTSQCVRKVLLAMFQWNILSPKSNEVLRKWFFKLKQYMHFYVKDSFYNVQCSPNAVLYAPFYKTLLKSTTSLTKSVQIVKKQNKIKKICWNHIQKKILNDTIKMMQSTIKQINDVLLIIIFNSAHYSAIPYLEVLFRGFYPRILYCGPENPLNLMNLSFVVYSGNPTGHRNGSFNYECIILAYNMFPYMPGGYFVIGDDILLFPHQLISLKTDKIWFLTRKSRAIVDFGQKCKSVDGKCVPKESVRPEHLKMWFVEYFNNTQTMLLNFHKEAKKSITFYK